MSSLKHLHELIRTVAEGSDEERLAHLEHDRWIDYPRALAGLARLEGLVRTPLRTRMPWLLIHGDSDMGKTMMVRKFYRVHKPTFERNKTVAHAAIILTEMPPSPQNRRLYAQLLRSMNAPFNDNDNVGALESNVLKTLMQIRPKMIVIDEVHNLLAGSRLEQRSALNTIKFLSNQIGCVIVALGTNDALTAFHADAQIASRFRSFELPHWQESDEFRRLMAAFERLLPLRQPSNLDDREIVRFIIATSNGLTGEIVRLLTEATRLAIRQTSEKITLEILQAASVTSAPLAAA